MIRDQKRLSRVGPVNESKQTTSIWIHKQTHYPCVDDESYVRTHRFDDWTKKEGRLNSFCIVTKWWVVGRGILGVALGATLGSGGQAGRREAAGP